MECENLRKVHSTLLCTVFYSLLFQVSFIVGIQQWNETTLQVESPNPPSSYYFQVDALEDGSFHATVRVGMGYYVLDIDTGSDLTWISCSPINIKFLKPLSIYATPHDPYTNKNNLVSCTDDAICEFVKKPINAQCSQQNQQCDYQVEYADHGTSLGVLVKDLFLLPSTLKPVPSISPVPALTFGCGYHQEFDPSSPPPFTDGVLGLGTGNISILSQLNDKGLIKTVTALCLSRDGPGYLVLGDSKSNLPETMWMTLLTDPPEPYNMLGPAYILYQGIALASGVLFLFDSGTTFNYFNSTTYQAILLEVNELAEKIATPIQDPFLPVCWKPFGSSNDFLHSFSSIIFSFTSNVYFELQPTDYLLISPMDNVCLGILDSQELGPEHENLNIIGDISVLLKLVIYDYENNRIGWNYADCGDLPEQLSASGPTARSRRTRKVKGHKEKDMAHWKMKKKLGITSP